MPALVEPVDLTNFLGSPFASDVVQSAAESVRDEAGWHIAPKVTETLTVVSRGGTALLLPSLWVLTVTAIRDVSGDTPEVLTGWKVRRHGLVRRNAGWPIDHDLEVDLTHGYDACPDSLLSVIADRARTIKAGGRVVQESLGSRSVTMQRDAAVGPLAKYKVVAGP